MNVQIKVHNNGDTTTISISGRLDFNAHREFRLASEEALKNAAGEILVDMDKVNYLDSSALGMLLLLRDKAHNANRKLALLNCKGITRQILEVANFHKLLSIR